MRKLLVFMLLFLLVTLPLSAVVVSAIGNVRKALILSSLDKLAPMGYYGNYVKGSLTSAGYSVTVLNNGNVTLDFITTKLNNYNLIIWRTNTFSWNHATYWYVGERANPQTLNKYSKDFTSGAVDMHAGIIGVSLSFLQGRLAAASLQNVKLMVIISSTGDIVASAFTNAGVRSIIYCMGTITLQFGTIDDLTTELLSYLAKGQNVHDAVFNTIKPYTNDEPTDPELDQPYEPPFWFTGDGTLTIS
jgi:hypothetical protein